MKSPALLALPVAIGSFILGLDVGQHGFFPAANRIVELTDAERTSHDVITLMTPKVIELHVVPYDEWRAAVRGPMVEAFTNWEASKCRIFIPEGWPIFADPPERIAVLSSYKSRALAHEILHCYRGAWHPAWGAGAEGEWSKQ